MVKKYVILADSNNTQPFVIPRQLTEINGEKLVERTVRLLKENGIQDIMITAHDKRFDGLGAVRYEPLHNYYVPKKDLEGEGYWLNAFPIELLNEPLCFLFGDVYYSEDAIKKIVETDTNSLLFFCTYKNESPQYIKHHDEPLGYKVVDYERFKRGIEKTKRMKDDGLCCREPVVWELYRVLNGQEVNVHVMKDNYVAINDISCDVDCIGDAEKIEKAGEIKMIKVEVIEEFTFGRFSEIANLKRRNKDTVGRLYIGDTFECSKDVADYLLGNNGKKKVVVKLIEIKPDVVIKKEEPKEKKKKDSKKKK